MIQDVADDFDVLEYSSATAGAVLDTLALLSGSEASLTPDSQVWEYTYCSICTYRVLPLGQFNRVVSRREVDGSNASEATWRT